jgi:hypothetical protein
MRRSFLYQNGKGDDKKESGPSLLVNVLEPLA